MFTLWCVVVVTTKLDAICRSCIGQRFARLELYALMVKVVQSFRLEYAGEGEVGQTTSFVTIPDRQIKIKFTARS